MFLIRNDSLVRKKTQGTESCGKKQAVAGSWAWITPDRVAGAVVTPDGHWCFVIGRACHPGVASVPAASCMGACARKPNIKRKKYTVQSIIFLFSQFV